jgi:malate synthase
VLEGGRIVDRDLVSAIVDEKLPRIQQSIAPEAFAAGRWQHARCIFEHIAMADDYVEYLTLAAYEVMID